MTIYLYVKWHSITGLKYFGRTEKSDPFKYNGSGKYWLDHIKKHGKEYVQTIGIWKFDNQDKCTKFALDFSAHHNIVESKEWANLKTEDGLHKSGLLDYSFTEEQKIKQSISQKRRFENPDERYKAGNGSRKHYADEKNRNDQSERIKSYFSNDENRQKHSKIIKEIKNTEKSKQVDRNRAKSQWQDPEYRKKQMAIRSSPEYKEKLRLAGLRQWGKV